MICLDVFVFRNHYQVVLFLEGGEDRKSFFLDGRFVSRGTFELRTQESKGSVPLVILITSQF